MNINGMGGASNAMLVMNSAAPKVRQQADTAMAQKMLPMAVAENAGRAATEAKGMFVDTYA
jgi:hypothetical protein